MTDLLFFSLYLKMEFQEGVTFEEWFYNGILTNSNFILIVRLAHCPLSVPTEAVCSRFDIFSQEPRT